MGKNIVDGKVWTRYAIVIDEHGKYSFVGPDHITAIYEDKSFNNVEEAEEYLIEHLCLDWNQSR